MRGFSSAAEARVLVALVGPFAAGFGAAAQVLEGSANLAGRSTIDLRVPWHFPVGAVASLVALLLALLLLAGCVAFLLGRDGGRRACLWSCGLYLAVTVGVNLAYMATNNVQGCIPDDEKFLLILLFTVPYPALVLHRLRSPLPPGTEAWRRRGRWRTRLLLQVGVLFAAGLLVPGLLFPAPSKPRGTMQEVNAVAVLRNLASCQAQVQASGRIDADGDGIGEYGTFLEMTGAVGVRQGIHAPGGPGCAAGSDFSRTGSRLDPPVLGPALAGVDGDGIMTRSGYCFRIWLADTGSPAGFVHEKGPAASPGLAGGTGRIGVDRSEAAWFACAWPASHGGTGRRAFFVDQGGDVLQSSNEVTRWSGKERPMAPESAFARPGPAVRIAIGTVGRDGEVWTVVP